MSSDEDDLDCQTVSRMISAGLDGDLPSAERDRLRLHFALCEACRRVQEQMGFLRRAMQRLGAEAASPDLPPPSQPEPPAS